MTWPVAGAATLVAIVLAAGGDLAPLDGAPLRGATGIHLLVADTPPFRLDVDSGKVKPLAGVGALDAGIVSVVGVAGNAGVMVNPAGEAPVFSVRGRPTRVASLGKARDVVPAADGRSVWLKASAGGAACVLRQVRLDGTATGARSRIPCGWLIQPGGSLGVVARRTLLVDPASGRTIYRARWGILAVAGRTLVLAGPGKSFTVVDVPTGAERRLRWPSTVPFRDEPAVDPRGRFVALAFAHPAWPDGLGGTAGQALDVWLLDTRTGGLQQVPGFPALVGLKSTSMEWTSDGRLVLLGESGGRDLVAVWRPGQPRLALKTVRLPQRSGSDSFAPFR